MYVCLYVHTCRVVSCGVVSVCPCVCVSGNAALREDLQGGRRYMHGRHGWDTHTHTETDTQTHIRPWTTPASLPCLPSSLPRCLPLSHVCLSVCLCRMRRPVTAHRRLSRPNWPSSQSVSQTDGQPPVFCESPIAPSLPPSLPGHGRALQLCKEAQIAEEQYRHALDVHTHTHTRVSHAHISTYTDGLCIRVGV